MDTELLTLIALNWAEFAVRWLHVITAIAWIGSSFYFIALDLGLRRDRKLETGADGEEWQVHGGGFYHIQKYLVAPASLPEHLTWFKWESYATWMSGFALMVLVYYLGADLYLIDLNKAELSAAAGIGISLASIVLGWVGYSMLCRSKLGENATALMVVLYLIIVALAWGFDQVFTGRAAFLHLGAITATIMSANVFMVIIPNQKIVVADLKAGKTPDAKYGKIAKQRSTHNNYLTLPVIFLMLSNHYPLAFGGQFSWVIASLVFLMGVTIRHYFNTVHARGGNPRWTWAATAALFLAIIALSLAPLMQETEIDENAGWETDSLTGQASLLAQHPDFQSVTDVVMGRCSMCHAAEPFYEGVRWAPKGVVLETPVQIATFAESIVLQSALSHAMPPANVSYMEDEERKLIRRWYQDSLNRP
ncbi:MAG: urate hydroxylase PuuD [Alphaproteobacteria bacterium]|nr:urate hydroxylase PuuD [Alphaproteobacteria bacterium]